MSVSREAVVAALREIKTPAGDQDVMSADMIRALNVENGQVRFVVEGADAASVETVRTAAVAAVEALVGVEKSWRLARRTVLRHRQHRPRARHLI